MLFGMNCLWYRISCMSCPKIMLGTVQCWKNKDLQDMLTSSVQDAFLVPNVCQSPPFRYMKS